MRDFSTNKVKLEMFGQVRYRKNSLNWELEKAILKGGYVIGDKLKYRFPSLFAVDTFRHFGPRILNLQIKSQFLTRKLSFLTNFVKVNKQICRYKVHK